MTRSTFGKSFSLTLFGESHGEAVGFTLDGLPAGIVLTEDYIAKELHKRSGKRALSTARREKDAFRILSGVYRGFTTGSPLTLILENTDIHSGDYETVSRFPRPSHADYTGQVRDSGFNDPRGGGHFSGRLTAPLVAAGAIFEKLLEEKGICIGTHILRCRTIQDRVFDTDALKTDLHILENRTFPMLEETAAQQMQAEILEAQQRGDSLGAVLETAVCGLPAGIGDPFFDSVESVLSHLLFSVPAVKGVQFGTGFGFADLTGATANDAIIGKTEKGILTRTNHNGGINGGITNGMPMLFSTVIKPTPSIALPQDTIDLQTGEKETITVSGRHDPAIFPRAVPVLNAVTAIGLSELLLSRYGESFFGGRHEA